MHAGRERPGPATSLTFGRRNGLELALAAGPVVRTADRTRGRHAQKPHATTVRAGCSMGSFMSSESNAPTPRASRVSWHVLGSLALIVSVVAVAAAVADDKGASDPFASYGNKFGQVQSLAASSTLDPHNAFFDAAIGGNGQACVTCHQPDQGLSIQVDRIKQAFDATQGLDPLFRTSDTADRPDADVSTPDARKRAYSLFLALGVTRIGKTFAANTDPDNLQTTQSDFRVEHQNTPQFGPLPVTTDPQHQGIPSLALFRRPLVNSNITFDSTVLWDGRAKIDTLATSQVPKAVQSLLLGAGTDTQANKQIADFMLGVFTDQISSNSAKALGPRSGASNVDNLLAMAKD